MGGQQGGRCGLPVWVSCAGLAAAIASALGGISSKQAILLGVPAVVLALGGLTVAVMSDPAAAERQGFRAGLKVGSLRRRWRSVFDRQGKRMR